MAAPFDIGDWKTADVQEQWWNARTVTEHTQMGF